MRSFIRTSYAALALAAADIGSTPATVPVDAAKPEAFGDKPHNSNVASVAVKPTRKLSGAATAKPGKADKPVAAKPAKPAAAKPEAGPDVHGIKTAYRGASPVYRAHGHKLSPIVLDRVPNSYTDRDSAFLKSLHAAYAVKPFARRDIDAGALSRLIGHGYVKHVSGNLDQRDAAFAVTAKAVAERFKSATAAKAKA